MKRENIVKPVPYVFREEAAILLLASTRTLCFRAARCSAPAPEEPPAVRYQQVPHFE